MVLHAILSSPRAAVLEQALSAASLRQKVISNNIANVNTPEYKKSEVSFEDMLQSTINGDRMPMLQTNVRHFSPQQKAVPAPQVNVIGNTSVRKDGNNVDIDVEMANLAKNSIYYNAVVQQLSSYYSGLKTVIREGK